ncbi:hypothetical protein BaRGS_00010477 [Batillaria attramentaria]|uniref:Uncharacterized protein n=1 Tax=Batillaria attramentaria TaxID=370345 RepID=A0ABD0LFX2_9CAEN
MTGSPLTNGSMDDELSIHRGPPLLFALAAVISAADEYCEGGRHPAKHSLPSRNNAQHIVRVRCKHRPGRRVAGPCLPETAASPGRPPRLPSASN